MRHIHRVNKKVEGGTTRTPKATQDKAGADTTQPGSMKTRTKRTQTVFSHSFGKTRWQPTAAQKKELNKKRKVRRKG